MSHPEVRGSMRKGKNYYTIIGTDGKSIVGLENEGKAIVIAMELTKMSGLDFKPYEWYEERIWWASNGKREITKGVL